MYVAELFKALVLASSLAQATAYINYTAEDMMRTQMTLLSGRADDCPPWYVSQVALHTQPNNV